MTKVVSEGSGIDPNRGHNNTKNSVSVMTSTHMKAGVQSTLKRLTFSDIPHMMHNVQHSVPIMIIFTCHW